MSIFSRLLPGETSFFEYFERHVSLTVRAAQLLASVATKADAFEAIAGEIRDLEHEGDRVTHTCLEALHRTFITPIDRDAIHRLMGGLDDILDLVNEAAQRVVRYKITEVPAPVGEATRILVEATQACERAVAGLRNMKTAANILEECEKINACENAADVVNSAAVAELFETGGDPLMVIKWRDIYDSLENAADATEDVANIVEGIVLEHG